VPDIEAPWPEHLPATLGAEGSEAVTDAIQVWRRGGVYITSAPVRAKSAKAVQAEPTEEVEDVEEVEELEGPDDIEDAEAAVPQVFRGMDERTGRYLTPPVYVQSAVQFSCGVSVNADEWWHTEALTSEDPLVRLQALVVLMKVKAPRTVAKQWQVLQGLDDLSPRPGLARLLGELHAAFEYPALKTDLLRSPPKGEYGHDHAQQWALRAAGAARCWDALARLRDLSTNDNLDTSLAAERSLADFKGRAAEEALAHCVLGWRYNAWIRAAATLSRRDPVLLERTLLEAEIPQGARYQAAVFLGRLGNPRAVPMLCADVGGIALIDGEMFDLIESLAGPEHRALVEALPDGVREEQRERAEAVRASVLRRLAKAK